ncbi:type I restriction modification enzyme protein S [Nocardia cyriacigeorgica]|nr:type I restriction modification enzyme protein S [Nocardia cyriacigeorgica]
MGQAPPGESYNSEGIGYPLVAGAGDFGPVYPKPKKFTTNPTRLSAPGDIILGIRATIGVKTLADQVYCLGRGVAGLRVGDGLDGRFLWNWLTFAAPKLAAKGKGATFLQVNRADIGEMRIPLPSLDEQRRIAAILDHADALRAKRRETLARLDELTQSIFIDMFGDPAANPRGFKRIVLGDVIEFAKDGPHVSPTYAESGVPFLSSRHVRPGVISWNDLKYLTAEDAEAQWKKIKPRRGDILYTKGGTTGYAAEVRTDMDFAVWVHIALLRPIADVVNPSWLEAMLNTAYCYRQSQELTHGIANRDLGLKRMVKIAMYLPDLRLQERFASYVAILGSVAECHRNALAELDALFASLQSRAYRGEL